MRAFRIMSNDVILSQYSMHFCSHMYWKGHPLWLLSHREPTCHAADMTLFECDMYIWSELQRATQMTEWLECQSNPTNRPVLFQTGSWEQQRRCLVSSASTPSTPPPCLVTANMSDGVQDSMLDGGWFDFSLCDTSVACHVVLCPSVRQARPGQAGISWLLSCLQTAYKVVGLVGRSGGGGRSTMCVCVAKVTSHHLS